MRFNGLVRNEEGNVLVFFLIILIPLLTVAALAIDAGNLYRARLALQSSADATAVAAVNYIAMRGKIEFEKEVGIEGQGFTPVQKQQAINNYLRNTNPFLIDLGRANMAAAGYPHELGTFEVAVEPNYIPGALSPSTDSAYDVEVVIRRPIAYLLMDAVPFFSRPEPELEVRAASRRRIAYLSAILDVSDSTACPASGNCDCKDPPSTTCPMSGRKYDKLLEAVVSFLKMFDLDRDVVELVPFNTAALPKSVAEMRDETAYAGEEFTESLIDTLGRLFATEYEPGGATNICDAFMRASASMKNTLTTRGLSNQEVGYVFFSDGAPTAGRFLFTQPDGLAPWTKAGNNDYVHHSVAWKNGSTITVGPSLLYKSGYFGFGCKEPVFAEPALHCGLEYDPSTTFTACPGGPSAVPQTSSATDVAQAVQDVFGKCLKSLEATVPGNPARLYGAEITDYTEWRKMYYHCAIELADQMRMENGTIYVVGLGEYMTGSEADGPYQHLEDVLFRKDIFLSRIALDPIMAAQFKDPSSTSVIEFNYSNYRSYSTWKTMAPDKQGEYFPTADADEIKFLFGKIARKIMLRLVS